MLSARHGPVRMTFRADARRRRLVLSVPRSVGGAVVRNRCRRRVREALRILEREGAVSLSDGEYRFSVFASLDGWPHSRLKLVLVELAAASARR